MKLRDYQQEAHDALFEYLKKCKGSPILELPTGAGKSVVIAAVLKSLSSINYRSVVLARSGELVEQNADKLLRMMPDLDIGIYSAGLRKREYKQDHVFATVQSVATKSEMLGYRNLILVDEAHEIPRDGGGQYRTFLNEVKNQNAMVRMAGLTATPYRLDGGPIIGDDQPFDGIAYKKPIAEMVTEGWITPLTNIEGPEVDLSSVKKAYRDFDQSQMQEVFSAEVSPHVKAMVECADDNYRTSCLVFSSGVKHAHDIAENLKAFGERAEVITGETLPLVRAATIADFKEGRLRWLINCDVLTTGFDAERVDMVAVLRATESPGLWYQIVGRGMRLWPGKQNCIILDFGGNIRRHGPLDHPDYGVPEKKKKSSGGEGPTKQCPTCHMEVPAGARECRCGFVFPPPDSKDSLSKKAETDVSIMAGAKPPPTKYQVIDVSYNIHEKKDKPSSLRVNYEVVEEDGEEGALNPVFSQWWCFNHDGYARRKAEQSWMQASDYPVPETTAEAWDMAVSGALAVPTHVTAEQDGKYMRVTVPPDAIPAKPGPTDQKTIYDLPEIELDDTIHF